MELEREEKSIKIKHQSQVEFLEKLKLMNVDVTRYLVSQYQHPDKIIAINGNTEKPNNTQFQFTIPN